MVTTIKKLKSGYINGTRVAFGNLSEFLTTSNITNLSFLGSQEDGVPDRLDPQVNTIFFNFSSSSKIHAMLAFFKCKAQNTTQAQSQKIVKRM